MRRTRGSADFERQRGGERVRVEPRPQPVDHVHGVRQVGVEQHERQPPFVRLGQEIRLAHVAADQARDLLHRELAVARRAGRTRQVRCHAHERQEVLRAHRAFELVAQDELERFGCQDAVILIEKRIGGHHEALSSSASLIL
jgi:hypothetical protein